VRPGGLLIVEEFAKERFTGATASWYFECLGVPDDLETWRSEHADVHAFADVKRHLDARFTERHLSRGPYLFDYLGDDSLEALERQLIDEGRVEATGVRYVGERPRV
jgi:hypothetical protein